MVRTVLSLVLVTNDVRQHHFHKQKIYLQRIFPLIQPLFPLRKDYFHENNIHLHLEIIHCIQAIRRHWSREPIPTLSRPSMFMSRFIRTDYHARTDFHMTPAFESRSIMKETCLSLDQQFISRLWNAISFHSEISQTL